jgi:hypothetical protein
VIADQSRLRCFLTPASTINQLCYYLQHSLLNLLKNLPVKTDTSISPSILSTSNKIGFNNSFEPVLEPNSQCWGARVAILTTVFDGNIMNTGTYPVIKT